MGEKIIDPVDFTPEMYLYLWERWAVLMEPHKDKVIQCGIGGIIYTEKMSDMPKFSYCFTPEGILKILGLGVERESDVIIEYDTFEIGLRTFCGPDLEYAWKAIDEGKLRVPEKALKMVPMWQEIHDTLEQALKDTEAKFGVKVKL